MTKFDFLHDAPPAFVERLRPSRIPEHLRTPLAALATSIFVVAVWWLVQNLQLQQAAKELAVEKARAIASRADLALTRVRRAHVEDLAALDNRVRAIRRSGAVASSMLADIANHVPQHAWLSAITQADGGFEIDGNAGGLDDLSRTLASLMSSRAASSPTLVRAARETRDDEGVVSFQLHTGSVTK